MMCKYYILKKEKNKVTVTRQTRRADPSASFICKTWSKYRQGQATANSIQRARQVR